MKNLYSFAPYHDSSTEIPCSDQILMFDENPSLGVDSLISEPSSCCGLISLSEVCDDSGNILDPDGPIADPFVWDVINDPGCNFEGNYESSPSGINGESFDEKNGVNCHIPQSSSFGNPMKLSMWPVPPSPYSCPCCHMLREIIHINGNHIRNLEIHGRLGIISHAVLNKFDFECLTSENHEYQMFDFCKESIGSVKNFLFQYCEDCRQEGYSMLQDPLSNFYQALCIGCDDNGNLSFNDFLQSSSIISGCFQMNQQNLASQQNADQINGVRLTRSDRQEILSQHEAERKGPVPPRSSLVRQRERAGRLKLKDFSGYFHLPINDAAKKMKVCPTVIKKKCRQGGLSRWPYRKIKCIMRKMLAKKESLTAGTVEERAHAQAYIQMLEEELANIFGQLKR